MPPVDAQVVGLKLVTPAGGTLDLSESSQPELFRLARVGLGALGVVTELTLQLVPSHVLVERTFTASAKEVKKNHARRVLLAYWLGRGPARARLSAAARRMRCRCCC